MDNFKKYLPSKKFISIILFIIILIVLFLSIKGIISYFKNRKGGEDKQITMTVGSIIQKDSNDNGIADWEEYLWGLDPNKNGEKNKEFILAKKNELAQTGGILNLNDDSKYITENEILSREFFSTIISLQQTGDLNEESLRSLSETIGKTIEATPIIDVYTNNMVKVVGDSTLANNNYFANFKTLVSKYEEADIGSELTLISQGIGNNDPQALYSARIVATTYKSFGAELMEMEVPNSISIIHLSLANNYEKTGQSIEGLTQILSDPIIGMRAIINYKNYSDDLVSDISKISEVLQ